MLHLSEFEWTLISSAWVVFHNFLLIDATDRSKIRSDQKRLFFTNTPFKKQNIRQMNTCSRQNVRQMNTRSRQNIRHIITCIRQNIRQKITCLRQNDRQTITSIETDTKGTCLWQLVQPAHLSLESVCRIWTQLNRSIYQEFTGFINWPARDNFKGKIRQKIFLQKNYLVSKNL